jgi:endonuclease/exonuclease/phosphatase (EEP) superfamily protein YafD
MFEALGAAGFANTAAGPGPARRPIDWVFVRGGTGEARVMRAEEASDHDPIVAAISKRR